MPDTPLEANQPHVAIVLLWYPLFTQPFIFREVENLAKITPLAVYTLYDSNLRKCSGEMKKASRRARTYGAKKVFSLSWEMFKQTIKRPRLMGSLFKRSLFRKWPDIETFGENLWGFWAGPALARQFEEDGIDFIYAPWPRGAATAAWVASSLTGIPFGISARGDNLDPADPDLYDKLAAARIIRANNATDQHRLEQLEQARDRTTLIYNSLTLPVPDGKAPKRFESGKLRLLALGRFDVTKGFDVLLEACSILKQRGVDFRLTLAGGGGKVMGLGALEDRLLHMRKALDLENDVDMPGLISHDILPQVLNSHDIFVAPCVVDKSGRRDGIPNTVIEALAFAMPVVATDVGALPEVIQNNHTGLVAKPGDAVSLADRIMEMAENPERAAELGKNGAALVNKLFDGESNAVKLANMFRRGYCGRTCAA